MDDGELAEEARIGHEELDRQHRALFLLHAQAVEGTRVRDPGAVHQALSALREATFTHFAFEERLMAESGYPERSPHAGAHSAFLRDLDALVAEASNEACSPLVRLWLESRYASWWMLHVRSHDAKVARHLRATTAAAGAENPKPAPAHAPSEPGEGLQERVGRPDVHPVEGEIGHGSR